MQYGKLVEMWKHWRLSSAKSCSCITNTCFTLCVSLFIYLFLFIFFFFPLYTCLILLQWSFGRLITHWVSGGSLQKGA